VHQRATFGPISRRYVVSTPETPDALLPSHGPRIEAPRETCARLIGHRLERERCVRAAVNDGADTLDEVLDAAYEKDLTGVRDLARGTVLAHLEKLAVEGTVSWDGERAALNPVE